MTLERINSHEVIDHLRREAAHRSSKRYVCFTKKWLCDEFVVMTDSDSKQEVIEFFLAQPQKCREESPRLVFDQLIGAVIFCHNEELVLSTMDVLKGRVDKRPYLFRAPTNTWSIERYIARQFGGASYVGAN
jgi:hypothetical protein